MNSESMEREILETSALEGMAVVTDLPNTPPVNRLFPNVEDHTDVPAVDIDVEIVYEPNIDVDLDVDVVDVDVVIDINTPHVDSN